MVWDLREVLAMKEAMLYEKRSGDKVFCHLCNHHCVIGEGKAGICQVRVNRKGVLYSMVYGRAVAENVDPIEKKPVFHVFPGTRSFSIATCGCNFRCLHCQNHEISQMPREDSRIAGWELQPKEAVQRAVSHGCKSISYTYTEPTIFFEYALDTARIAHENGLLNIFVTNGFMTEKALETFHPYLDAANVDLKAGKDSFYKRICGARIEPVKASIRKMRQLGVWVEITTLIIPQLNDDAEELRKIAQFILSLGPDVPWHVSAFYPTYNLRDRPPTAIKALQEAREIGLEVGLHYVYSGNVPGDEGESTYCPSCEEKVIERYGYRILSNRVQDGRCSKCGTLIHGMGI